MGGEPQLPYIYVYMEDVLKKDFACPKCGDKMFEKRPKDKFIVRDKDRTVRLSCVCGYYRDDIVSPADFKEDAL